MIAPIALTDAALPRLARRLAVPTYDRSALTPSVVHMSVGSFHRSHQAMYFDELAERRISSDWGLVGVGLHRRKMRDVLDAQDGLFTVVARGADGDEARVCGVIARYLFAPEDGEAVLATLADARTRLVTLTVTGGGYKIDPATGAFDADDPEIAHDRANPTRPQSAVGHLVEALDRRRRAGLPAFTVLSCDNVPGNGRLARSAVLALARLRDPELAAWIEEHGAFPSSMVDRITPRTTADDRAFVAREFGVADRWPVMTEPFSQWVIEDSFCNGRPPLDAVGARFVDDVRPHALLKTRLLNASHCALGFLGTLSGHERTDAAMADPVFGGYVAALMRDEVAPLLPAVDGVDLAEYRATLLERLANPRIGDQLARLCRAGSSKMPVHVLSSIAEARAAGRPHPLLTLAVAGWLRHLRGVDADGRPFEIDDPLAGQLQPLAEAGGTDPRPVLAVASLFGALGRDEGFAVAVEDALVAFERDGVHRVVEEAVAHGGRTLA